MNEREIAHIVTAALERVMEEKSKKMTLSLAKKIIHKVILKAEEIGVKAVVAVTDEGANPVCVECMDDSYIASYDIALNKAYTVVGLKMSTKDLKPLASPGGSLYGIQFTNNGRIVIFGGGVPLKVGDKVIGGVGVSGGTEEQDTYLADYAEGLFEEGELWNE